MSAKKTADSQVTSLDDDEPVVETAKSDDVEAIVVNGANSDDQLSGKRVKLTIHTGSDDAGNEDVFLSLNGYGYQIKRGTPVDVPSEVAELLTNAVETRYRRDGKNVTETQVPRYAFSVYA